MPENHIQKNHIDKTNPVFYLYKLDDKILAYQAFSLFYKKTPFTKRSIPIMYINLSYKDENTDGHIKNFALKSNAIFLRENLGMFWFLKKFILAYQTYNPKVVHRSSRFFTKVYPNVVDNTIPTDVHDFAQQFYHQELHLPYTTINGNLVKDEIYEVPSPISSSWETLYKASEDKMNQLFIKNGVIDQKDNEYFLTGRAHFIISYNNPFSMIIKKLRAKY